MPKTALELSREEWGRFFPARMVEQRLWEKDEQVEARWEIARAVAAQAAALLRAEFGAEVVLLFGSLTKRAWFTPWSDIDLAAQGIPPERFYSAVAAVTSLSPLIKVDLIDLSTCQGDLRTHILEEGREI